jgi:hypothetical protein
VQQEEQEGSSGSGNGGGAGSSSLPDKRYAFFTCGESAVVMVGSAFERLFMQVRGGGWLGAGLGGSLIFEGWRVCSVIQ